MSPATRQLELRASKTQALEVFAPALDSQKTVRSGNWGNLAGFLKEFASRRNVAGV